MAEHDDPRGTSVQTTRRCPKCHQPTAKKSGYCTDCHRVYVREHRKPYREFSDEEKRKNKARSHLNLALQRGQLDRGTCIICGGTAEAHHPDYSRPLHVVWLCREHHMTLHRWRRLMSA